MDSVTGAISRTYDGLNRLTLETTPQGSVSYGYNAAGRRTTMTAGGQSAVNYSYDADNRLVQITQGSSTVGFAYDTDSRRSSLTLPNGIVMSYSYDTASQLSGINYTLSSTTIGNLTYSYDSAGRKISTGGTFAGTGLPASISTTEYDAANELTQWGTATPTYDSNGNVLSDGTNSYVWNARNQLASMNSGGMGFQYDAFGRRVSKTNVSFTTNYLYDGLNAVQELSGGAPTANLLTGGLDEYFQRTDSTGTANFLTDALGSTLSLTDGTGASLAQYTYEPFGNTTITGSSSNPHQYTGRENDGTGVYFYRSRFYSPGLQRFISEDPMHRPSDTGLYSYADNNPISLKDPLGLWTEVDFWQPSGIGESSQGHVSININGQSYSWGPEPQGTDSRLTRMFNAPGFMDREDAFEYYNQHSYFRDGTGYVLNLTPDQENALQRFLNSWVTSPPKYNLFGRNCTAPVLGGLSAAGVDINMGAGVADGIGPVIETPGVLMLQLDATPGLVNGTISVW